MIEIIGKVNLRETQTTVRDGSNKEGSDTHPDAEGDETGRRTHERPNLTGRGRDEGWSDSLITIFVVWFPF